MEWDIVKVIITLVGFGAVVIPPIVKQTRTMAEVAAEIKALRKDLNESEAHNSESHERIYGKLDEHEKKIADHEMRIHDIEEGR